METEIISILKSIFYENYYKHFLLSNLPHVDDLYIPPSAFEHNRDHTEIPDIQAWITSSLFNPTTGSTRDKSYIVFGNGGTGKTSLALSIVHDCWKMNDERVTTIPIYFHLPQLQRLQQEYRSQNILSLFLNFHSSPFKKLKNNVTETDIFQLFKCRYQLLLVLDSYEDFVNINFNLWEQNGFEEYNLKTIILCRPEALTNFEFDKTFSYKVHGTMTMAKYLFLLPFTSVQISSYLLKVVAFLRSLDPATVESMDQLFQLNEPWIATKEITKHNPVWKRDSSEYRHWFGLILPELGEISQTPFLLCLLVQVLPTIVEEYRRRPSQSSFDMKLVQLVSTEVGIYDQFTQKYFEYSSKKILQIYPKLKEVEHVLCQLLEIYSRNLALHLFNKRFAGDDKFPRKDTEEWNLWKPNENCKLEQNRLVATQNMSHLFPNSAECCDTEKVNHLLALRSGCLLRYFNFQPEGENYMFQFLHASLFTYFVSRTIFKGLRAELNFHLKKVGVPSTQFSFSFESIRSCKYVEILHMLVERARVDLDFKSLLMSSNAFTILTQAFRVWCNEDFSYVNIADADISHCIFTNCKFNGANMRRVLLTGTFFYKSHLKAVNLYNCYITGSLNFHLQESVFTTPLDQKFLLHFEIVQSKDEIRKIQVAHVFSLSDLQLYDVNKRTSKVIVRPRKLRVTEFKKFPNNQHIFLVVFQSLDRYDLKQTLGIADLKRRSKTVIKMDQKYLQKQREAAESQKKEVNLRALDEVADGDTSPHVLEIFTTSIPNYDEKVVCYRDFTLNVERIVPTSHYFPLTMSNYPFSFSIRSSKEISNRPFCLFQCMTNCTRTLFATSCGEFVSLYNLQEEKILFQKKKCQEEEDRQVVVTFVIFSPDGKYLLFDMGRNLYILSLKYNDRDRNSFSVSCTEVSLFGSEDAYSSLKCIDFSTKIHGPPLVALVYTGSPLVINIATGQILQSIKNNCALIRFICYDNQLQLICGSVLGSFSSNKIQSDYTGDPRSIQTLNPRTDYHCLVSTDMEVVMPFVSSNGKYMAVIKRRKNRFKKAGDDGFDKRIWLSLFKICSVSGKRTFVFNYSFLTSNIDDIQFQVFFINETFMCLSYPTVLKKFKCDATHLFDSNCVNPIELQDCIINNFQRCWYHEPSQQIVIQRSNSTVLEVYSIEIDPDGSSLRYQLNWQCHFDYSAANVIFYVNEPDNCAYVFPFGQSLCYIWNLNTGSLLTLSTNISEYSYKLENVKHVSTIFAKNGLPVILIVDFGRLFQSFDGIVDLVHETLTFKKIKERTLYQRIQLSNCFLYRYIDTSEWRCCFAFGTENKTETLNTEMSNIETWNIIFTINPIHYVDGFQLTPVTTKDNVKTVRLLTWDLHNISCFEVDLSGVEEWKGEKEEFSGWRLIFHDPPNNKFSLLNSDTTNAVVSKHEDWKYFSKKFHVTGNVQRSLNSFLSLSSLYEQIHESPSSIFSKKKDLVLSENDWILIVIAKKKGRLLDGHSGIVIEGLRHDRHFAFRTDLFLNADKTYEITIVPLKDKKDKYVKTFHTKYLATEFKISSEKGELVIDKILRDKQSEIDYRLRYNNCNSWVKSLLSLIGEEVERKWPIADMSNDFLRKNEHEDVLNFPLLTAIGNKS